MNLHSFKKNINIRWSDLDRDSLSFYQFNLNDSKVDSINNDNPNRMIIDVKISGPQFLAVSEMYYPNGWYASIDGESTEIFEVNDLIRRIYIYDHKAYQKKVFPS